MNEKQTMANTGDRDEKQTLANIGDRYERQTLETEMRNINKQENKVWINRYRDDRATCDKSDASHCQPKDTDAHNASQRKSIALTCAAEPITQIRTHPRVYNT